VWIGRKRGDSPAEQLRVNGRVELVPTGREGERLVAEYLPAARHSCAAHQPRLRCRPIIGAVADLAILGNRGDDVDVRDSPFRR
jgi:hypothetical protein